MTDMNDDELREWLTKILMEFGAGPIRTKQFHDCKWFQGVGMGVENFTAELRDTPPERQFFTAVDPGDSYEWSFTQRGLDFIKGGDDAEG